MVDYSSILALQRNGEKTVLFEGNNQLPFFWLMLLDKADIDCYKDRILQLSGQDVEQIDTSIAINKLEAISCAAERRVYIQRYYRTCLALFDDWIYYMQRSDFSDMKIYIDLYQAYLCHPSPDEFCNSLQRGIVCFDEQKEAWYEETIAGTCGYEEKHKNKKRFKEVSNAYHELNRKNIYGGFDKKIHLGKKMSVKKKSQIVFFCIILAVIGAILLFFVSK